MTAALAALGLVRRLWPYLLGGAALIGALGWIDRRGHARGVAEVEARDAKAATRIAAAAVRLRAADDAIAADHAAASTVQQAEVRTIYAQVPTIVDRPVYRSQCIDADGAGLLDHARASANRDLAASPADAAAGTTADPARR